MVAKTQDLGRCRMEWRNEAFVLGRVSHLALACSDMWWTREFSAPVPGMRLIKTAAEDAGARV